MIGLDDIKKRALAHYYSWLSDIARNDADYSPLRITRIGESGPSAKRREEHLDELVVWQKGNNRPFGFEIELAAPGQRSKRSDSKIKAICFPTEADLLEFLSKTEELNRFRQNLYLICTEVPELQSWCQQNVKKIVEYDTKWPQLLEIVRLFINDPQPQLPIKLWPLTLSDTKFVEPHEGILCSLIDQVIPPIFINEQEKKLARRYQIPEKSPMIQCAWNDPRISAQFAQFTSVCLPLDQLKDRPLPAGTVLIIENSWSLVQALQFPLSDTVLIFGTGSAAEILKELTWLKAKNLFYWGDLDAHGMEIYAKMKAHFPHLKPLMMDLATFEAHPKMHTIGSAFNRKKPSTFEPEESALFDRLVDQNLRLEQEKMVPAWVKMYLERVGCILTEQ